MRSDIKHYSALIAILSVILFSCETENKKLHGLWESILIENESSLFAKTLPSSVRGEVILIMTEEKKFTWLNKSEKLNLYGKYEVENKRLILNIDGENKPLEVEFSLKNNKLIIVTPDDFKFTFVKKD